MPIGLAIFFATIAAWAALAGAYLALVDGRLW